MKVCKFRIAVLVLLAVTVIYGVTLALNVWRYCQIENEGFDPNLGHWIGEPELFFNTKEGFKFFIGGVGLFCTWIATACFGLYKCGEKKERAFVSALLIPLLVFLMLPPVKAAESSPPLIRIGVLCAGDEEFMADPENVESVELGIWRANTFTSIGVSHCFEGTFGVHFEVVGWVTWESDNDVHDSRQMAWEVWNETGFYTGMVVNGQYVDMLHACTGQDIEGYWAVTFPDANITLAETVFAGWHRYIRHEFSHQLEVRYECGAYCVMSGFLKAHDWCQNCFQVVNDNKFKFTVIGDVSGDYKVDMRDVRPAAKGFGSVRGDANWAASCDIDGDGSIDMYDIRVISSHFGESRY